MELGPLALIKPGAARSDYSIPADDSREVIREGGVGEELVVNALRCRAGGGEEEAWPKGFGIG
jgi:hypothetical protein